MYHHFIEITAGEIARLGCQWKGCKAGPGLMQFERITKSGMKLAHFCPYGHRHYYQIKTHEKKNRIVYNDKHDRVGTRNYKSDRIDKRIKKELESVGT